MSKLKLQAPDLLTRLQQQQPTFWLNPNREPVSQALPALPVSHQDILDAAERLSRFAPLLSQLFPELEESQGIIESALVSAPGFEKKLASNFMARGSLYLKVDHSLPIAGSVKARGGIYEVLLIAETIATEQGLYQPNSSTLALLSDKVREIFAQYTLSVGSSGNLGLSIGVMASSLGFKSVVHMSADAKEWKKERLRKRGVTVVEHPGDFASAVEAGRKQAEQDDMIYFVDDENSLPLFLGYSVAALRLKEQLLEAKIPVDAEHPLFVYIPCGVGGAPGGITFGLKHIFGDAVHCFFAEPVDSPSMLVRLAAETLSEDRRETLSVYDIGLHNNTEADGLAVPSASILVAKMMRRLVSGVFTVRDDSLFESLYDLYQSARLKIEPSAAAAFGGPEWLLNSDAGKAYIAEHSLTTVIKQANHILWTTGGAFVPDDEYQQFLEKGERLASMRKDKTLITEKDLEIDTDIEREQ